MSAGFDMVARAIAVRARAEGEGVRQSVRRLTGRLPSPDTTPVAEEPSVTITDGQVVASFASSQTFGAASDAFRPIGLPARAWTESDPAFQISTGLGGKPEPDRFITWEWTSDAVTIELILCNFNSSADLFVDDVPLKAAPLTTTTSGNRRQVRLDWSGTASPQRTRRYRLSGINLPFGGVYVENGASVWFPEDRRGRALMAVLGDSYTFGTGAAGVARGWAGVAAAWLGVDLWTDGVGGTGWLSTGDNVPAARVANGLARISPDYVVVALGFNDAGGDAGAIAASMAATLGAIRTACPDSRMVVLGPWTPMGDTPALDTLAQTVAATASAAGVAFVPVRGMINPSNAARLTGPDAKHPTPAGHDFLGHRVAPLIARAFDGG